jgi:predicted small lipoprotein YifL
LYGAAEFGDIAVISVSSPSRWAVIVLATAVLALAGCGRKGPLDLPPNAAQPTAATAPAVDADEERAASKGSVFDPSYGADAGPKATKGSKRSFILDPLLKSD